MNIGLWGCGTMGRNLAKALVEIDGADLAVVYDADSESATAAAEGSGAVVARSQEQLLSAGLDGVMIALPSDLHAPAAIDAAEAGIHVLVEKPMSIDSQGCRRMIAAAERNEVKLMVGQVLRYYEPYRSILGWVESGRFGALRAVSIWRTSKGLQSGAQGWRFDRSRSGGMLFEVGIHELDMIRCLLGRPETVRTLRGEADATDSGGAFKSFQSVHITCENGGVATFETGVGGFVGQYGFRMFFDEATVTSDSAFRRDALEIHTADGVIEVPSEFSDQSPLQVELRGWLEAMSGDTEPPVPGHEGLATVVLAEAATESAQHGGIPVEYRV